jgi:signal transduction histidine kinase
MRPPWRRRSKTEGEPSVSAAVGRFALAGIVAVGLVGLASFLLMRNIGNDEATNNASEVTRLIGEGVVQPNLTDALLNGEPDAVARFDRLIRDSVLTQPIVRVKLWDENGKIVYSDEPRLIGQSFELGAAELRTLHNGAPDAEVSDLSEPENQYERDQGKLLEAYTQVRAPNGQPLLFETYQQYSSVTSSGRSLWLAFLPALILALVLLELVQLPLATSLARRVRGAHRERLRLLERAVDASDRERRRIAGDLHDGAVQDLAGVALSLEAASRRLRDSDPSAADALRRGAEQTRGSVKSLRSLLVEIYPPSLQRAGLRAALEDLLAPLRARGIETDLEMEADLDLGIQREALCFRVAQEAVRNALKHAAATRVEIALGRTEEGVELRIADDGKGFAGTADAGEPGHIGTDLLGDLAEEVGGELAIDSSPGEGTVVRLVLPGT